MFTSCFLCRLRQASRRQLFRFTIFRSSFPFGGSPIAFIIISSSHAPFSDFSDIILYCAHIFAHVAFLWDSLPTNGGVVTPWLSLRALPGYIIVVYSWAEPSRLSGIDTYYISSGICTYYHMGSPHAIICSPHRMN